MTRHQLIEFKRLSRILTHRLIDAENKMNEEGRDRTTREEALQIGQALTNLNERALTLPDT